MLAPTALVLAAAEQARAVPALRLRCYADEIGQPWDCPGAACTFCVEESPPEGIGRRLVYARSTGLCERCGRAWAAEWHHRKNRSQGGTWCPSNGLHLCNACHADIGAFPSLAMVGGFLVRGRAISANQPVRLHLHGWALLNVDGTVHALTDRSIL